MSELMLPAPGYAPDPPWTVLAGLTWAFDRPAFPQRAKELTWHEGEPTAPPSPKLAEPEPEPAPLELIDEPAPAKKAPAPAAPKLAAAAGFLTVVHTIIPKPVLSSEIMLTALTYILRSRLEQTKAPQRVEELQVAG